ncbi:MAG: hypothetical protein M1830_002444 [Pleopsidium flavum]|nr:MAG: hypothetical protein M1830_002444 [Pleopsidium flavum]
MTTLDPTVASALDTHHSSSDDEDALLSALENDPTPGPFREQRLQQLHSELARAKDLRTQSHGTYIEITDEKELMDITTSTKMCVVHFFKPDFARCAVMDGHLETLAPKHYETRFLRTNVTNAPFLVTKLQIRVLPCVLAFVDGISVDRIVGFEGLGYSEDSFTTRDLEERLLGAGVLVRAKTTGAEVVRTKGKGGGGEQDDDDDDDWD